MDAAGAVEAAAVDVDVVDVDVDDGCLEDWSTSLLMPTSTVLGISDLKKIKCVSMHVLETALMHFYFPIIKIFLIMPY